MKKSTFALIAILLFIIVSCTKEKQNNRLTNDDTPIYGKVIPHMGSFSDTDEIYIMSTFPPYQWDYYNATFDNYKDFEDSDLVANGRILERGIIYTTNSWNPEKENLQVGEIDSTIITPTIINPYIPRLKRLRKSNAWQFHVYSFRYYAELDNGKIVYSGVLHY